MFRVVDAMDAPHGGRILRLRLDSGSAPSVGELRGARLRARSPSGEEVVVRVEGFPLFGGKPSDERIRRSGRVDLRVYGDDGAAGLPIGARWEITGPLD